MPILTVLASFCGGVGFSEAIIVVFGEAKAGSGKLVSWFYLFLGISEALWDFGQSKASVGRLVLWLYFFILSCIFRSGISSPSDRTGQS